MFTRPQHPGTALPRRRQLALGAAAALVTALLAGGVLAVPPAAAAASALFAAPAGRGTACTIDAPCTLATAVATARPGATVTMLEGDYGAQVLLRGGGSAGSPVTVATRGAVNLTRLETHVPHLTFTRQRVTTVLYVHPGARGTTIAGLHIDGAGSFIRSTDVTVRDSSFEGGTATDGIQVKNSRNVLIEGNLVRDYNEVPGNETHVDCVQIFESHRVTVRANALRNCSNSGLILSPGAGGGSSDILIESNFIQGCVVATLGCRGGAALEAREPSAVRTVIRNNTIGNGATRIGNSPGLVFDRNLVQYLYDCNSPMTNTVVYSWNTAVCAQPSRLGTLGNRYGSVGLVNQAGGDLHLLDAAHASVPDGFGLQPAARDIDGDPVSPYIAGGGHPGGGGPGSAAGAAGA